MSYSGTELTDLVVTRISHDLIGNIGAIHNVLELADGSDGVFDPEDKVLMCNAVDILQGRQKFFRVAFGIDTKKMEVSEIQKICSDYLRGLSRNNPVELRLENITAEMAKLTCLCVMIAAEVFIKSGQITVGVTSQNVQIKAVSDYKLAEGKIAVYQQIMENKKTEENVSQFVQLIYLRKMLGENVPFKMSASEQEMQIVIG